MNLHCWIVAVEVTIERHFKIRSQRMPLSYSRSIGTSSPRPVHNDYDTDQSDEAANQVKPIWGDPVNLPAPKD